MARYGLIYSFVMSLIGSSLLAEAPEPAPPKNEAPPQQLVQAPLIVVKNDNGAAAVKLTPSQHLHAAVQHLREAGFEEDAERIQRQADELLEVRMSELAAKRKQAEQLHCEIAQLEQELGIAGQYELMALMGEISLEKLNALDLMIEARDENGETVQFRGKEIFRTNQALPAHVFQTVFDSLQRQQVLHVLAEPSLIVRPGMTATVHSGGKFPVLLERQAEKQDVNWRDFGMTLEAVVTPLGENRVRIKAHPKLADRDFSNAVRLAGHIVPGVKSKSLSSSAEMLLGETLILGALETREHDQPMVWFVAVTPRKVESPAPVPLPDKISAKLQPIPEHSLH